MWAPFSKTEHVRHRRGNGPENRCAHKASRVRFSGAPPILFHPSVAQQQSTRPISERPWSVTTPRDHILIERECVEDHSPLGEPNAATVASRLKPYSRSDHAGWLRQMSGGLKIRTGGRATHSSGQFRGIDVTASMSVFQTEHVGAAPTCRTLSDAFHGVTAALLFVGETESGQHRLRSPISNVRTAKSSSQWFANPRYPVRVRGARPVSSDTREPANSLGLGPIQARGSTGVSDHFWSVA